MHGQVPPRSCGHGCGCCCRGGHRGIERVDTRHARLDEKLERIEERLDELEREQ